jgi:hypothetical protein
VHHGAWAWSSKTRQAPWKWLLAGATLALSAVVCLRVRYTTSNFKAMGRTRMGTSDFLGGGALSP